MADAVANPWILYSERQPKDGQHCWLWVLEDGPIPPHWADATYCSDAEYLDGFEHIEPIWEFDCGLMRASGASHWAPYWLEDLTGKPEEEFVKAPFPPNSPSEGGRQQ